MKSCSLAVAAWLAAVAPAAWGDTGKPPPGQRHAHRYHVAHRAHAARKFASVPPAAPIAPPAPAAEGPAPVPNEAVAAPVPNPTTDATAEPSVFQLHYPPQGEGYVTGSSPQAMDDRNAAKATGVEVKVPLDQ